MTSTFRCREAVDRLWGYLDGELHDADHAAMEAHLAFCLRCCGELAFAREIRGVLTTRSVVGIPPDARSRLEAFVDELDVHLDHAGDTDAG